MTGLCADSSTAGLARGTLAGAPELLVFVLRRRSGDGAFLSSLVIGVRLPLL